MILMEVLEIMMYFCYCCVAIYLGVILNKKLYTNIKDEEHQEKGKVVQQILKTFALVQCIGWPSIMILAFILNLNKVVLDMIPMPLIHTCIKILRAMYTTINAYVGFTSLAIAITRYVFIVHCSVAERIGIRRLRTIFITSSIGVPMVLSILNESIIPVEEVWSSIFLPNYTYSIEREDHGFSAKDITSMPTISRPLLAIPNQLMPLSLKGGMQIVWLIILVLTYSNILEGFLYLHIYIYYYR